MANQPARPWFRLASMSRPAVPTPAAAPAPPPAPVPEAPRPPVVRPTFRPLAPSQPIQTQEPTPPPPAATAPPPAASPPPAPAPATFASPPPVATRPTTASVPSSPTPRASAPSSSVPTSPAQKATILPPSTVPLVTSTYSVPSSPKPTTVAAPSSSVPPSPPAPKAVPPSSASVQTSPIAQTFPTTRAAVTATARAPSPMITKPAAETPPKTFKPTTAPPPSPLNLPPSQFKLTETEPEQKIPMEAEQKTVLVQKTIERPKPWIGTGYGDSQREHGETYNKPSIIRNGQQGVETNKEKEKGSHKKVSDSEEMGMRVITIAGENKGASMELIHSPNKHDPHYLHKKGNPKSGTRGSDQSESYSSSDKEGNPKKDKSAQKGKATNSVPMNAFMNSNVQSINNSILYNSSLTHHDPGVHLALSRKPSGVFQVKDRVDGSQN